MKRLTVVAAVAGTAALVGLTLLPILLPGSAAASVGGGGVESGGVSTGDVPVDTAGVSPEPPAVASTVESDPPWTWDSPGWGYRVLEEGVEFTGPYGVHLVPDGPIGDYHQAHGGGRGTLGYPVGDLVDEGDGWARQAFERGTVYTSPNGTRSVTPRFAPCTTAAVRDGALGYPVGDEVRELTNSWYQRFERGVAYAGPNGTWTVLDDPVGAVHAALGGGGGVLGYPVSDQATDGTDRVSQRFERGVVYSSPVGTFAVRGPNFTAYHTAAGGGLGSLGYPVGNEVHEFSDSWYQVFEGGIVYSSPRGTWSVRRTGPFAVVHAASGGGGGSLGYPVTDQTQEDPGWWFQVFQRGVVYSSPYGTWTVKAPNFARYHGSLGGGRGVLGYPLADEVREFPGCWYQRFERGVVYSSTLGTWSVRNGPLADLHASLGGGGGALGYPAADQTPEPGGGWRQRMQRGDLVAPASATAYYVAGRGDQPALFAYGQLRVGQPGYRVLSSKVASTARSSIPGMSMYMAASGTYPWGVDGGDGIVGDVLRFRTDAYASAIAAADAYERYDPRLAPDGQAYVRRIRVSATGEGHWVYVTGPRQAAYVTANLQWISSGDWLRR